MHPRGKKTRRKHGKKRKTLRGGTYYGASGAIAPGAMQWNAGEEVKAADYQTKPSGMFGGKRRMKRRTHRMKGGERYAGGVSASFVGTGARGIGDRVPVATRVPIGASKTFNDYGAGPGNWGSFAGLK